MILIVQIHLYAQNEQLKKIYISLDSLIKRESQYFPKNFNTIYIFFNSYNLEDEKNRKNDLYVLEYLEPYLRDTLHNLRYISCLIINEIGITSKNETIRRRALNDLLKTSVVITDVQWVIISYNQEDFDKKAKERIIQLVRGEKTQEEIDDWAEYEKRRWQNDKWFKSEVQRIKNKDSLSEQYIIDSLLKSLIRIEDYKYNLDICNEQIYELPGWLYMYNYKSELEALLKNPKYQRYYFYIKLSLARMGEIEYENEILKNDQNWGWVSFICTQTAYSWLVDFMNRTKETLPCDIDDRKNPQMPLSQIIYSELSSRYILNFPKDFVIKTRTSYWSHCGFDAEELKKFEQGKIWLEKNKGKYKLDKTSW